MFAFEGALICMCVAGTFVDTAWLKSKVLTQHIRRTHKKAKESNRYGRKCFCILCYSIQLVVQLTKMVQWFQWPKIMEWSCYCKISPEQKRRSHASMVVPQTQKTCPTYRLWSKSPGTRAVEVEGLNSSMHVPRCIEPC